MTMQLAGPPLAFIISSNPSPADESIQNSGKLGPAQPHALMFSDPQVGKAKARTLDPALQSSQQDTLTVLSQDTRCTVPGQPMKPLETKLPLVGPDPKVLSTD